MVKAQPSLYRKAATGAAVAAFGMLPLALAQPASAAPVAVTPAASSITIPPDPCIAASSCTLPIGGLSSGFLNLLTGSLALIPPDPCITSSCTN